MKGEDSSAGGGDSKPAAAPEPYDGPYMTTKGSGPTAPGNSGRGAGRDSQPTDTAKTQAIQRQGMAVIRQR